MSLHSSAIGSSSKSGALTNSLFVTCHPAFSILSDSLLYRKVAGKYDPNTEEDLEIKRIYEEKNNIYIFLPIGTDHYSGDTFNFTVTIADGEEYAATLTIPEDKSIEAGMLYTAELSLDIPYVTFRAASEQTLDLVQTESPMLDASGNFVYADD